MALLLIVLTGFFYLIQPTKATRYPLVVHNVRQENDSALGFVSAPTYTNAVNVMFFGQDETTPKDGFHLDYAGSLCRPLHCTEQASASHCRIACIKSIWIQTKNQTHVCFHSYNPGFYSCPLQDGALRAMYVMPLLVVDIGRFFHIALDFLMLPEDFPNDYFVEAKNQLRNGERRTIKFCLETHIDSSPSLPYSYVILIGYKPGHNSLSLYVKTELALCTSYLLGVSYLHFQEVQFSTGKVSLKMKMRIDKKVECPYIQQKLKYLPGQCRKYIFKSLILEKAGGKTCLDIQPSSLTNNLVPKPTERTTLLITPTQSSMVTNLEESSMSTIDRDTASTKHLPSSAASFLFYQQSRSTSIPEVPTTLPDITTANDLYVRRKTSPIDTTLVPANWNTEAIRTSAGAFTQHQPFSAPAYINLNDKHTKALGLQTNNFIVTENIQPSPYDTKKMTDPGSTSNILPSRPDHRRASSGYNFRCVFIGAILMAFTILVILCLITYTSNAS
ncbi:uncharacterized protein LOC111243739 isoform X3 [Varroa destructor]|uniref:Uncharacterized protein n=1 Tax=Varroa destructor TaxID=109461 RepID=A0A7M7JF46_VARDE|nr:uncharacterized protein LOC111243739 isoform X3 [Varroa destructor]